MTRVTRERVGEFCIVQNRKMLHVIARTEFKISVALQGGRRTRRLFFCGQHRTPTRARVEEYSNIHNRKADV